MSRSRILIITKSDDSESIARLTSAVDRRGGQAFRFDTDRFPTEISIRVRHREGHSSTELQDGDQRIELSEVTGTWHRRLSIGRAIPESLEAQVRDASVEESRRVVYGVMSSIPGFKVDPWLLIRQAECKQLQLELAQGLGMDVPNTLVTNDPEAARAFYAELGGRMVTKMMASFAVYREGRENVVFTNPVAERDLEALKGLRSCPMTFQEHLEKQVELRVTVVGRKIFCAAVDSGTMDRSKNDWRREGRALMQAWKPYELPDDARCGLLGLMDRLGLNYGAADFVVTPDGRCVFLEVNPAGEWFWLDPVHENGISEALADVLMDLAPRRESALLIQDSSECAGA